MAVSVNATYREVVENEMKQKIDFDRDGLTLVGNLFTPEGFDENGHYQAVLVQGSFTSVQELMAGR